MFEILEACGLGSYTICNDDNVMILGPFGGEMGRRRKKLMMVMMIMMVVMLKMMASPWLETSTWWQAGTEKQLPLSL